MLIAVDAATIQPGHSAGVEAFTYGLLRGFTALARHDLRVSVLHGTGEQWRHRVPDPAVHWVEIDVALGSGSRLARLGRRHAPRWLLSSRAVRRTVNAVRDRARPDTGTADVTLHPFHGAPVRTGRSVLVLHDLRAFQPRFRSAGYAAVVRDNVARADAVVVSWPHPYRQVLDLFPGAAGKTVLIPPPTFHPPSAHATRPEPGLLVYPASTAP
ncbi:MAG TPA: hypothetical protein VHA75_12080, partial [Rugosimonospora sp.]|nr:hypothetical protein [Rugosimonospora sp.]